MFGYSIAENISFGKPGVTRDQIEEAAKKARGLPLSPKKGAFPEVGDRVDVGAKTAKLNARKKPDNRLTLTEFLGCLVRISFLVDNVSD